MRKRLLQSLAIGGGAALVAVALGSSGALDRLEWATWSWRASYFAPRRAPCADVKVVLIDQASIDWGAAPERGWAWPWPRTVYAPLLDALRQGGARVVAFDLLFTEASAYGVEDDAAFGEAIGRSKNVVGAAFYGRDKVTRPIPAVATNAAAVANVKDEPDPDGVFRRATLAWNANKQLGYMDALGVAAWRLGAGRMRWGEYGIPAPMRDRRLLLNFAGREGRHETYGAAEVIQAGLLLAEGKRPPLDLSAFSNAYVLIGVSAPGLMDVRPTPVSRVTPGVEVHATVLDNLLTGRFLRDAPFWAVSLYALLIGWAAAWCVLRARHARQTSLAFLALLPVPAAASFAGYAAGAWWPLVLGELAVVLALVGATLLNYATEGRQRAFIRNAFRYYLGDEVIEQMLADPSRLKLGGEKREISVFFSDLEKFSSFSERLQPEELIALLNEYLGEMGRIIKEEGGYVDKYIGDAIVAFWNAPVEQPDHAARACRAAVRCQRRLAEIRGRIERERGVVLRMRIGLNTGFATVGNMGSSERFNYTILGDAANLASRLEGANKAFGTYIMASESTWEHAGAGWPGRELARLRVVGRKAPVRVYELAGLPGEERPQEWGEFDAGRALFEAGRYAEARAVFARAPQEPASRAYAERCGLLEVAPPADGPGVWELTEK
jgi:adenylate cyclase